MQDKTLRCRAKGNFPAIQLEFELVWNPLRAAYCTLNPRAELHGRTTDKFKRTVFVNNVMRIKVGMPIVFWLNLVKYWLAFHEY